MRRIAAFFAVLGLLTVPVDATEIVTAPTLVIHFSLGGSLIAFAEKYNDIEERGGHVVIDGVCISACTLVLGTVTLNRVCTTERGFFAFHSASLNDKFSPDGTRILWAMYPKQVRDFLQERGWSGPEQEHSDLIVVDAARFVHSCSPSEQQIASNQG